MNRRWTWKEFITKRSTIWTLSLCLVGVVVLGSLAAVNSSRKGEDTQPETGTGQVAYLEEDLDSTDDGSSISTDAANEAEGALTDVADTSDSILADMTDGLESASGTAIGENTSDTQAENSTDASADTGNSQNMASPDSITDASADSSADSAFSNANADGSTDTLSPDAAANSDADSADGSIDSDADLTSETTTGDSAEASSANIISEQTLLEAGVSFLDEQSLLWPSAGTIAIDYSMDKSVYFATLNQYKYNPALIISSDTGNQVLASARGIVESITIDEETGTTLVLNIGNGYKLTYGQLMEAAVSEGDVVEAGDLLAYISEPTKYYSTEGSNLYFAMTKDGEPVDPVLYLE
ncbi:MAG: peptidoglycan DD-metalloendopeptidase family protein [Clostridiales bacterium]|nr:peptidoglycan DD-metalloendopeptidase family protein [Clostridiales bacterium]